MKPVFCPKCHRKIEIPKFLLNSNVKTENGIQLQCGWPGCKGKARVKDQLQTAKE